ncbi:MAG: helix-turn-helix transcriptional regulator [Clostridia bacterium]|nr:helix-turn-helix transcriptional regulator [Clostridia bacterium]
MSIGTTIKRLRRERSITQEQLAEYLGISTGAVSQWECDRTTPDITQIPVLANIFEVSADILLEIDVGKSKRAKEIVHFERQCDMLHHQGKNEDRLLLCREMVKKYPNDEAVLFQLMKALKATRENECYSEIITLGERLLASDNLEKRHAAIRCLCFTHEVNGNHDEALKYAAMIPQNEDLFIHILNGQELLEHCQKYFSNICNQMFFYINRIVYLDSSHYTNEERHIICKKLYDIYHIIHENADFGYMDEDRLGRLCFRMAQDSAMSGLPEQALDELERMVAHFDKVTKFKHLDYTSLLLNTLSCDESTVRKKDEDNIYTTFFNYLNNRIQCFESIADTPRFIAVMQQHAERANR